MNTPTHLLMAAGILSKRGQFRQNIAVILGGLAPDLQLYVFWAGARLAGYSESDIWRDLFWRDGYQSFNAISNSVPVFAAILLIGLVMRRSAYPRLSDAGQMAALFGGAGLIHLAFDLPFHADDAHPHFWPFTMYRFHSPFSYWNPAHHGAAISIIEVCIAVLLIAILWRRHMGKGVRVILLLALASYVLVPLYFITMM